MNDNYSDVIGYGSKEKKLKPLQEKVNSCFESLVFSQEELEKVTGEVQSQLGNIKEARNKLVVELFTNNSIQETFTFSLDRDIDQSLQALIMRLLPLATNYSNVVSWCEEIDRTDGQQGTTTGCWSASWSRAWPGTS